MRISALRKIAESGHHGSMSNDFKLIVHFSCPHCATIYTACQEDAAETTPRRLSVPYVQHSGPRMGRAL